jgi:peptidoglycan/xylan/chitin deacetylase (PgdA/CDA1 family)
LHLNPLLIKFTGAFAFGTRSKGSAIIPFTRRQTGAFPILTYHNFVCGKQDLYFQGFPVDFFESQVNFLNRHYQILPLPDLVGRLSRREPIPPNALALTFDDGYRDNYTLAYPVLKKFGVPATTFLTTNYIDQVAIPWNAELSHAIKKTRQPRLVLAFNSHDEVIDIQSEQARILALDRLLAILRHIPDAEKQQKLRDIYNQLKIKDFSDLEGMMMTWDQVREMKRNGISFGAHTVRHPILTRIPIEESRKEMEDSRSKLETELDDAVELFAYPNGKAQDFNEFHKALAKDAGFKAAFSTLHGMNTTETDPFAFRRGGPSEQTLPEFALKLALYRFFN